MIFKLWPDTVDRTQLAKVEIPMKRIAVPRKRVSAPNSHTETWERVSPTISEDNGSAGSSTSQKITQDTHQAADDSMLKKAPPQASEKKEGYAVCIPRPQGPDRAEEEAWVSWLLFLQLGHRAESPGSLIKELTAKMQQDQENQHANGGGRVLVQSLGPRAVNLAKRWVWAIPPSSPMLSGPDRGLQQEGA